MPGKLQERRKLARETGFWRRFRPVSASKPNGAKELKVERIRESLQRGIEGAGREHGPRNGGESAVAGERKTVPRFRLRQDAKLNEVTALTRRRLKGSDGEQWLNSTGASGRATNTSMRVVR